MMREAGIIVNEVPKIQVKDLMEDDHAMHFPETGFQIPLSLWGVFSCFLTSKPRKEDLVEPEDVCLLMPTQWNPHSDAHAHNEELMLDWEGNMTLKKDREAHVVTDELPDDKAMVSSVVISKLENDMVDTHFASVNDDNDNPHPQHQPTPLQADEVTSVPAEVMSVLNDEALHNKMKE